MKEIIHQDVNTRIIAKVIFQKLDLTYLEVYEVLVEEEKMLKESIKNGKKVELCNFVMLIPYTTKFGNKDCKLNLSRIFREELRKNEEL